jgi:release factor glutamine methyltransferase
MYSLAAGFYGLKDKLLSLYDEREAAAIAHEIMEFITGMNKTDRLIHKEKQLTETQLATYQHAAAQLAQGVPLQYITATAWFMGFPFYVSDAVLIPRPETEELVQWIVDEQNAGGEHLRILDVGTGSGCIPVAIKRLLPQALVTACDISEDALSIARKNANEAGATITFLNLNFLEAGSRKELGMYDIIVSNPPYIAAAERDKLHTNVRDHEPGLALFVPDDDPLVFYKALATFGKEHLATNGHIYCELDTAHATQTMELFVSEGYTDTQLRKDLNGNDRMLHAKR